MADDTTDWTTTAPLTAKGFRAFCLLTFAFSWGLGGAYILLRLFVTTLPPLDGHNPVFALTNAAPSLAALVVVARTSGLVGVKTLLFSLVRPFHWVWLVVSALLFPVAVWILSAGAAVLHAAWPVTLDQAFRVMPWALLTTPVLFANIAPIGEELGWRGLALPYLLGRHKPLTASLIIGLVRIVWHLPAFVLGGMMVTPLADLGWWCLGEMALTVVMTLLFLRANGNVLVAGVVPHALVNALGRLGDWASRPAEALIMLVWAGIALCVMPRNRYDGPHEHARTP